MDKIGFFVKFALVLTVLAVICMIITEPCSLEFYMSLAALIACLVVIIVGAVILYIRNKRGK